MQARVIRDSFSTSSTSGPSVARELISPFRMFMMPSRARVPAAHTTQPDKERRKAYWLTTPESIPKKVSRGIRTGEAPA